MKKIKDIYDAIWDEAYIKIFEEIFDGLNVIWEGYAGDLPPEYMEMEFKCIVPMDDYGPVLGIEVE